MCDKLVFDLAQEVESSPNVFVRKDWINILDNQNQNYNNNQSVIDTSQLSNSNKYMSYREAYFSVPFLVTLAQTSALSGTPGNNIQPATAVKSIDYSIGLKNWFGQIIHSFTLDYNGTTIVQQTPYVNMWNSFKLMTSLSLDDINTQGATIGFYPDDPMAWAFVPAGATSPDGMGVCNNRNYNLTYSVVGATSFSNLRSGQGNNGLLRRQMLTSFDTDGIISSDATVATSTFGNLLYSNALQQVWKSYISTKSGNGTNPSTTKAYIAYSVVATIYLKHVHSFFNMCPLLKGVFMKMTLNLNNTTSTLVAGSAGTLACSAVTNPLGGVNPLMIASTANNQGGNKLVAGADVTLMANISVGSKCLDATITTAIGGTADIGTLSKSVYLYIPAYTFNPVFEQAYLSTPVKQIRYTDIYQYQVLGVTAGQNFNNLITNGIANIKSVLILPFYSNSGATGTTNGQTVSVNSGFLTGVPVWQSPFDPAGTGPTSPLVPISNFNIQVSGQNAIYNLEKYSFEQFNNQLYGQNAVNGGLTDGITSGLIDRNFFDYEYCYYYVNVERMLPVEQSVPKSIQVLGQNYSAKTIDLICFVEYGNEISIDALTGARV